MPFDILGYKNKHKDYYGEDAPLEEVAKSVFDRTFSKEYPDYDTWKKSMGIESSIQEDNIKRNPPPPPTFFDKLIGATSHIASTEPVETRSPIDWTKDTAIDVTKGVIGIGETAVGLADIPTGNLAGKALSTVGYDPIKSREFLESGYSPARQVANKNVEETKGFINSIIALAKNPSVALGSAVESAPGSLGSAGVVKVAAGKMLATAGIKAGTAAATKFLSQPTTITKLIALGAATEGIQATGSIQEQGRQQDREWSDTVLPAIVAGIGTAGISFLTSKLLPDAEVKLAVSKLAGGIEKSTLLRAGKNIAMTVFKEGLLEEMPQSAQEQIFTNLAMGKTWNEGVLEAAAQGAIVGGLQGGGLVASAEVLNRVKSREDEVDQYIDNLKQGASLTGMIYSGMMTGKVGEHDFTNEDALAIIRHGQDAGIYTETDVDRFKLDYPQLNDGINDVISERVTKKISESIDVERIIPEYKVKPADQQMRERNQFVMNVEAERERLGIAPSTVSVPLGRGSQPENLPSASALADVQPSPTKTSQEISIAANEAATSKTNDLLEPTEAQKEAGNYKKGPVSIQGLDISIENPAESSRKGIDDNGKPWETPLEHHYGYIKKTEGKDGDHVDVFVGNNPDSPNAYIIDQKNQKTGKFDEHKTLIGFDSVEEARKGYLANYDKSGESRIMGITEMPMDQFKEWLKGDTTKPISKIDRSIEAKELGIEYKGLQERVNKTPIHLYNDVKSDIPGSSNTTFSVAPDETVEVALQKTRDRFKKPKEKVTDLITKPVREFHKKLLEDINKGVDETIAKTKEFKDWQWQPGDKVKSNKTGKIYDITHHTWDKKRDVPMYGYKSGSGEEEEKGHFMALKAHNDFIKVEPLKAVKETKTYGKGIPEKGIGFPKIEKKDNQPRIDELKQELIDQKKNYDDARGYSDTRKAIAEEIKEAQEELSNLRKEDLDSTIPQYGFRGNRYSITFEDDIDKAAYLVYQGKGANRVSKFVDIVKDATGIKDVKDIIDYGRKVKDSIRSLTTKLEPETAVTVPKLKVPQYAKKVVQSATEQKRLNRQTILSMIKTGKIDENTIFRSVDDKYMRAIFAADKLVFGQNFEGGQSISASKYIPGTMPPLYGGTNNVVMIGKTSMIEDEGGGVNDWNINPKTSVRDFKYLYKGKQYNYDSLKAELQSSKFSASTFRNVKDQFINQQVIQLANGNIGISLRNGQDLIVKSVDRITPDRVALQIGYGKSVLAPNEVIAGAHQDGVITLVKGVADKYTLAEESFHAIEQLGVIHQNEIDMMKRHIQNLVRDGKFETTNAKDIGGYEDRAKLYIMSLQSPPTGLLGRIIIKIQEFIDQLVNAFGIRTVQGIMRDVRTGDIYNRSPEGVLTHSPALYDLRERLKPFFSQLDKVITEKMGGKMPIDQLKSMLKKNSVTDAEIENLIGGLEGMVTKQQVIDEIKTNTTEFRDEILTDNLSDVMHHRDLPEPLLEAMDAFEDGDIDQDEMSTIAEEHGFKANYEDGNETYVEIVRPTAKMAQFSQYQEPGAVEGSYREMFVTAPGKSLSDIFDNSVLENRLLTDEEKAEGLKRLDLSWSDGHSSYSDIQNPIVRIRYNDRIVDGKKILFIEEMQSPTKAEQAKMPKWLQKKSYDIGVKRVLALTKEGGYDGISWTTGEMQADRYDLSKQIDSITWDKFQYSKKYKIAVAAKDGKDINFYTDFDGIVTDASDSRLIGKPLSKVVSKDIAKRIMEEPLSFGKLEGLDLKVGGEDLKHRYDVSIPSLFKRYNKEPISEIDLKIVKEKYVGPELTQDDLYDQFGDENANVDDSIRKEARDVSNAIGANVPFEEAMIGFGSPELAKLIGGRFESSNQIPEVLGQRYILTKDNLGYYFFDTQGEEGVDVGPYKTEEEAIQAWNDDPVMKEISQSSKVPFTPITDKTPASYPQYSVRKSSGLFNDIMDKDYNPNYKSPQYSIKSTLEAPMQLLAPGLESMSDMKRGIQSLVLPTAKSPEHLAAAEIIGKYLGSMNRENSNAAVALNKDELMFTKLGVHNPALRPENNDGMKFASDMSMGRRLSPEMRGISDRITSVFTRLLSELRSAGVGLDNVRENYFPGMWTKQSIRAYNQALKEAFDNKIGEPSTDINEWTQDQKDWVKTRVDELVASKQGSDSSALSYLSKRPFKGKETFRKPKVFDDIMTAIDFGLVPISPNPIELVKLKFAEMSRSIMANKALREFESRGEVINVDNSGKPLVKAHWKDFDPSEWRQINDKYGIIWHTSAVTGLPEKVGYRVAKKPVADIMNNYLSSNLYNNPYFGKAFQKYMGVASFLNQSQLSVFSAFHAGFTTSEVTISQYAETLKDIYGFMVGNRSFKDVVESTKKIPGSFIRTPMDGASILKEWETPTMEVSPDVAVSSLPNTKEMRTALIAKAAEIAGGGFKMEYGLKTEWQDKMIQEWYGGNKLKAALRSPVVLTEITSKPILSWLVPRQKAGIFGELAWRLIETNPEKTLSELTPELRQAWNRIDARMGQVQYNRLFINNVAKNTVQALVRAPGWTGGTITEIGGSLQDAGKFISEWIKTGKAPKDLPDRVAYTIALMTGVAAINGLLTFLFTGEEPEDMDFWAFRDGGLDPKGKPSRWLLPTYQKDVHHYMEDPGNVLLAKTHPLLGVIADIFRNKDFYGVRITNSEDPMSEKVIDTVLFGIKQFVPFWMRGVEKEAQKVGGLGRLISETPQKVVAPQIGIMPATSSFTNSDFEKYAYELRDRSSKTKEEFERGQLMTSLELGLRRKDPDAMQKIKAARDSRLITPRDSLNLLKRAKSIPLLSATKHLSLEELVIGIENHATDEEKRKLLPALIEKFRSTFVDLTIEDRRKYHAVIKDIQNSI